MTPRIARHPLLLLFVALALALPLAACGGDNTGASATPSQSAAAADFPVTIKAANGKVTIDKRPERIVSLSPTATEMLFAIGAGDQVIAAEENSNYPEEAPDTKLSGFEPNVEAIAAYDPDLVIASNEPGDLEASIEALDIPFLLQPAAATLDDTYGEIEELGDATGHVGEATQVRDGMIADIAEIRSSLPTFDKPPTYFHELDDTYFTATSKTFIGLVYAALGLENIADAADKDGTGYPQLSAEYIIKADPDLIFLADTKCCGQSAETVADRPGWDQITAVKNGGVVELDDDVASRWGPRVVDFFRIVADAMAGLGS
jgi:iron complex transport system substrate-binding protein